MFSFVDNIFWLLPIILLSILFGFVMILWNTYLIKHSPKTHKSTILSIYSFAGSIWYFTFWTIAWYMVEYYTLSVVYSMLPFIIMLIAWFWLYYYTLINKKVLK